MRLVFAGTPEFARTVLAVLLDDTRHEVVGVLTQPDKPVGRRRGLLVPPPVKELALERDVQVLQPEYLTVPALAEWLAVRAPDAVVVAAYGKLIPGRLLTIPPRGFINVHASLLPRWRGAAPVQWAIVSGDPETGVCIMQMDEGTDTGPVWSSSRTTVHANETAGELTGRLAELGSALLLETLGGIEEGLLGEPKAQDAAFATSAPKLRAADLELDWTMASWDLHRMVMAANPWPGATVATGFGRLTVWRTRVGSGPGPEESGCALAADHSGGEILAVEPELVVVAGDRPLTLLEVQVPGKRRMSGAEFARGRRLEVGGSLAPASDPGH